MVARACDSPEDHHAQHQARGVVPVWNRVVEERPQHDAEENNGGDGGEEYRRRLFDAVDEAIDEGARSRAFTHQ